MLMEIKKLDDACEIEYGTRVVQEKHGGTIFPVYGGGGATFNMDVSNREDCLVIARFAMSKQCTRFIKGKFFLNDSGLTVKPKNKNELNQEYLNYQLLYLNNNIYSLSRGTAQRNLNVPKFRNLEISFPKSLSEQIQIVKILSKAQTLIEQRKQSIALIDEFLKSTFLEMFGEPTQNEKGWEIFSLSDVCLKITDGTHDTPERLTEGIKYITGKHITPFNVDFDNSDYVTEDVHKEIYRRTNVEFDDILYTNIGANVGTAARVKVKFEFSLKNVALLKQNRNKLKSHYLEHLLNLSNFKHKLLSLLSIGGAQKFLNLKSIGKIKIPVPPIELQTQFANIVKKTETLKDQYKNSLVELENLYGSLSQQAFKGELEMKVQTL